MLHLPTVTLLCVETRDPELAHWAIEKCLVGTQFAKIVLVTNLDLVKERKAGINYVQAPPIRTTKDYSEFLLTGLDQYVVGSHVLIIQWDSFITNPALWSNAFLDYDYIGPVWPHHPATPVGNGGFSLRSIKLLNAMKLPQFMKRHPEDVCICIDNKAFLENDCQIQFAPVEIAEQFAVERTPWHDAFGFHGFFNFGKMLGDDELGQFLDMLPSEYLGGLDTYDLLQSLQLDQRTQLADKIIHKLQFRWKMRRRYLRAKLSLKLF
ncbi:DUF5672 family protein [Polynucleobacter antarcticus]|uniref:DUF5672 domain-containing protein n=1 Tax=Polynucleobacter antarcticus TaxID=1743162 RepID=A0A6M9PPQ2_9BURK|nr:DUF5672 family protein [Polynucleobacter antarcticus]QKM61882.1 hypothetical protein DCO16_01560 [Polynucleobacter antarcticus]